MQPVPTSGPLRGGRILLLVGAIVQVAVGVLLVGAAIAFFAVLAMEGSEAQPLAFIAPLYLGLGVLAIVGAVVAFLAQARAKRGDAQGAWVRGLVASFLPPIQVITLVGAVLCLTSPERDAQRGTGEPVRSA